MPEKRAREQFWQLYQKLPQDLKDALFAEETTDAIENVCKKYKLSDKQVTILVDSIGQVLLGVLPPDEFQKTLEKELKLKKEKAKKVAQEINRFVFYPVKSSLEEIYKVPVAPPPAVPKVAPPPEEKPPLPPRRDIYREPIE